MLSRISTRTEHFSSSAQAASLAPESAPPASFKFSTLQQLQEQQEKSRKQDIEALAYETARAWKSCPQNSMQLKDKLQEADADGDGLIDKNEFANLLANSGAKNADAALLFSMADKDGDGELTQAELQALAEAQRSKFKAQK